MKVQTLLLGEYNDTNQFCLYQFPMPISPPLTINQQQRSSHSSYQHDDEDDAIYYYCIEDLDALFKKTSTACTTTTTTTTAISFRNKHMVNLYHDYPSSFCKDKNGNHTFASTKILIELATLWKSSLLLELCQLTKHHTFDQWLHVLKKLPTLNVHRPSSNNNSKLLVEQEFNPVPLNGQEWFLKPWIHHPYPATSTFPLNNNNDLIIRLSPPQEDIDSSSNHLRTKQSSLLLQRRLAPKLGQFTPSLTIHPTAYKDHSLHTIQTAPLRKHKILKQQQHHHHHHRFYPSMKTATHLSSSSITSIPITSQATHFPMIPQPTTAVPIVASQQRRPIKSLSPPPSHPHHPLLLTKKQQFLQPFEYLFDTLEQTRVYKATLDDQIRHSSLLMSKLQSMQPMIEEKVNEHVEKHINPYLDQFQACMDRLVLLEQKWARKQSSSPSPSLSHHHRHHQNDLSVLLNRIEQLEKKVVTEKNN